jgi:lysine 6-dehydrogenase
MKKVVVLGAGLVGGPIAKDLSADFEVIAADISSARLEELKSFRSVVTVETDLSNPDSIVGLLAGADFAINAVPGALGYKALETCIRARVNTVDIAFMPEDVLNLNELALQNKVCVISDMGVAPGMSNLLSGYAATLLEDYRKLEIYVGGLPKTRTWPWEYKAVFSPADVIEEYTRPARLVRNGKVVVLPALSESELIEMPVVGTLEAFNSDGLRSLIHTLDVPEMVEKTCRYMGHAELMRILSHAGFFSSEEIKINNQQIKPLDLTSKLLFSQWKLEKGEHDLTVMKIIASGIKAGKNICIEWELFDEFDAVSGIHSMARTTGYAATAALRLMNAGLFMEPGVHVPEIIGRRKECVDFMLSEQEQRGIVYRQKQTENAN